MSYIKIIFLLITLFSSSTFAFQPQQMSTQDKNKIAETYNLKSAQHLTMLNLKGYQQSTDYTCGPAIIMSILHYYGKLTDKQMNPTTELQIAKEMGTTKATGTSATQIVVWLKQHGFTVKSGENGTIAMLQQNLNNGIPTLVEWIDWGGHWVAVTGYNADGKNFTEDKDTLFFTDPSAHFDNIKTINGITAINPDRFFNMWFDALYSGSRHIVKGIYITAVPK